MKPLWILTAALAAASAQTPPPPNNPRYIQVILPPFTVNYEKSATTVNATGAHALEITLRNNLDKAVTAYILRIEFRDPLNGGKLASATVSRVVKRGGAHQQWKHPLPVWIATGPDGRELACRVTVDYALYEHGSVSGADTFKLGGALAKELADREQ
jgi:hypothetical protein